MKGYLVHTEKFRNIFLPYMTNRTIEIVLYDMVDLQFLLNICRDIDQRGDLRVWVGNTNTEGIVSSSILCDHGCGSIVGDRHFLVPSFHT